MELSNDILLRIEGLKNKFDAMGQDMASYLDGLLYADYLTYWDYVNLDTLLTLQHCRTNFKDEKIFIVYHQITELYFNLCLHELEQLCFDKYENLEFFTNRVNRVNRYFTALTTSFGVMVEGMETQQFLKFRMSLLPASGFQSAQYRKIEIHAAPFIRLVDKDHRENLENKSIDEQFEYIYWKAGATELATGKKTLTLIQFEKKYSEELLQMAKKLNGNTLYDKYEKLGKSASEKERNEAKLALRDLDINVNINWPLMHYKSAARYLERKPEDIAATGGTNWQKYLPPRFQKRIFYPLLWQKEEMENWGKGWVETHIGIKY